MGEPGTMGTELAAYTAREEIRSLMQRAHDEGWSNHAWRLLSAIRGPDVHDSGRKEFMTTPIRECLISFEIAIDVSVDHTSRYGVKPYDKLRFTETADGYLNVEQLELPPGANHFHAHYRSAAYTLARANDHAIRLQEIAYAADIARIEAEVEAAINGPPDTDDK